MPLTTIALLVIAFVGCSKVLGIGPPALEDAGIAADAPNDATAPSDARPLDAPDARAPDAMPDAMPDAGPSLCRFDDSNFDECLFAP